MMGDSVKAIADGVFSRPRSNTLTSTTRRGDKAMSPELQLDTMFLQKGDAIAQYNELKSVLEAIEKMQKDCVKRVRHLEGSVSGIMHKLPVDYVRSNGDVGENGRIEFADATAARDVESQVLDFQVCLEVNLECVNTALRDLVRRRLKREYVECQTESTSITAREAASQTLDIDDISEDFHAEKIMYSLPDLDVAIRELRINSEVQTDLQMDHFIATGKGDATSFNRDNVVIIYRNPNVYSFLKPYFMGVGGSALGALVLYKVIKTAIALARASNPTSA